MIQVVACRYCAEDIPTDARICPYCVTAPPMADGTTSTHGAATARHVETGWTANCPYCAEAIPGDAYACPYCASITAAGRRAGHLDTTDTVTPAGVTSVAAPTPRSTPPAVVDQRLPVPAGFSDPPWAREVGLTLGLLVPLSYEGSRGVMFRESDDYRPATRLAGPR